MFGVEKKIKEPERLLCAQGYCIRVIASLGEVDIVITVLNVSVLCPAVVKSETKIRNIALSTFISVANNKIGLAN